MYACWSVWCGTRGPPGLRGGICRQVCPIQRPACAAAWVGAGSCHVGGCRQLRDMLDAGCSCQAFPCWFQGHFPAVAVPKKVLASVVAAPTATLTQTVTVVGFGSWRLRWARSCGGCNAGGLGEGGDFVVKWFVAFHPSGVCWCVGLAPDVRPSIPCSSFWQKCTCSKAMRRSYL